MMVLAFHWHQPIDGGCVVHQHFNIMLPTWDLELNTLGARQLHLVTAASRCLTCKASFFFGLVGLQDGQRVTKAYIPYTFFIVVLASLQGLREEVSTFGS
jgi:hypothetical protein